MRTTRVAVIGLGDIAQKAYLPVVSRHPGLEIVSVMSRRQETVDRICAEYRFPSGTTKLEDVFRAEPEAVFLHSPTETHAELALACLRNGQHVYVDKPLSYDIGESEQMAEEALKRGKLLAVGFNRRFAPLYQEARAHVEEGGRIEYAAAEKHRIRQQKHSAKRTLYDDLIHMLDLLVWLAGEEPVTVGSSLRVDEEGRLLHGSGGVESRGFVGQFAMNRAAGIDLERLSLYGAGRSAEVTNLEQGFFSSVMGGEHTRSFGSWAGVLERRGFAGVIQHFLDSLDSPEECELRADRTLATHRLVEQLIK